MGTVRMPRRTVLAGVAVPQSGPVNLSGTTALYGGSFNPPHMGHQMVCLYLLEALGAKEVWVIPTANHPLGKDLVSWEHRLAMCRLLVAPLGPRVRISEVEKDLEGQGRTYVTVSHLCSAHPDRTLALVVGADILGETQRWYRWKDLEAMVQVVVVGRTGFEDPRALPVAMPDISSRDIRGRLQEGRSITGLVPRSVKSYIQQHNLYGP